MQSRVLVTIKTLKEKTGQVPTAQEIANKLGMGAELNGRERICSHLRQLQLKGYLSTSGVGARNIRIV